MAGTGAHLVAVGTLVDPPRLRAGEDGTVFVDLLVETDLGPDDAAAGAVASRYDVRAFGELARNVNASLAPGGRVLVTGHLASYLDSHAGVRLRRSRLLADVVAASLEHATTTITTH